MKKKIIFLVCVCTMLCGCATIELEKAFDQSIGNMVNLGLLSTAYYSEKLKWPNDISDLQKIADEFKYEFDSSKYGNCSFLQKSDGSFHMQCHYSDKDVTGDIKVDVQLGKELKNNLVAFLAGSYYLKYSRWPENINDLHVIAKENQLQFDSNWYKNCSFLSTPKGDLHIKYQGMDENGIIDEVIAIKMDKKEKSFTIDFK